MIKVGSRVSGPFNTIGRVVQIHPSMWGFTHKVRVEVENVFYAVGEEECFKPEQLTLIKPYITLQDNVAKMLGLINAYVNDPGGAGQRHRKERRRIWKKIKRLNKVIKKQQLCSLGSLDS